MMAESIVLALAFGIVVSTITSQVLAPFAALVQTPRQDLDLMTQLMARSARACTRIAFSRVAGLGDCRVGARAWDGVP